MASPSSTAIVFMPAATAHGMQATRILPTALSAPTVLPTTYSIPCGAPYINYPGLTCVYHDVTIITTPPPSSVPAPTARIISGLPEPNFSFRGYLFGFNAAQDARCYIEKTTQVGYCIKTIRDGAGKTKIETARGKDLFTAFYLRDYFATVTVVDEAIEAAVATATELGGAIETPAATAAPLDRAVDAPTDTTTSEDEFPDDLATSQDEAFGTATDTATNEPA